MFHRLFFALLGSALVVIGLLERGWWLLSVWLGLDFLALAVAHVRGAHRLFGKRPDGTIPAWSRLLFGPFFVCVFGLWHLLRLLGRQSPSNEITPQLVVGRRLLAHEAHLDFDNYVDLTAEFTEPRRIRHSPAYWSFPILDGAAPLPEELRAAIDRLRPGRTFIHCAQGYGRTGMFAVAVLLRSGIAGSIEEGIRIFKAVRPGIRLSKSQRRCIEEFAKHAA